MYTCNSAKKVRIIFHLFPSLAVKELLEHLLVLPGFLDNEVHPGLVRHTRPEHPDPALQEP